MTMAFSGTIDFWTKSTAADGEAMSEPLKKLLANDNYLKTQHFDAVCSTADELSTALADVSVCMIEWKGDVLIENVSFSVLGTKWVHLFRDLCLSGCTFLLKQPSAMTGSIIRFIGCISNSGALTVTRAAAAYGGFYCQRLVGGTVNVTNGVAYYEHSTASVTFGMAGSFIQLFWRSPGDSELDHGSSMSESEATESVSLCGGTASSWSAHGCLWTPPNGLTPSSSSIFRALCPVPVSGGHYILAAYEHVSGGTHALICAGAVTSFPSSGDWLEATVATVADGKRLNGGARAWLAMFTDSAGVMVAGRSGEAFGLSPYPAATKTGLGALTAAPSTLTWEAESPLRPFISITK
jgi:hypothetical protein